MTLDFFQIYFEDWQVSHCYDFAIPYRNEVLTDFFENDVIAKLVPKSQADYISVCSWRLKRKRYDGITPVVLKNDLELSKEKILLHDFDIANLRPFSRSHQMLANARYWHGGVQHNFAWDDAETEMKKFIRIPDEVKTPIYENHFIARKEIYHSYVNDCLIPAMEFIGEKEVFKKDSGYAVKKERDRDGNGPEAVRKYRERTGRNDWPIAPFILERLFSIWINDKNFKIINI